MSYSLQIRGGDLNPSGGQMATVTGVQKVVQDLRCALLEPRGTDPLHPDFGSLLNGGIDELGQTNPGVIGNIMSAEALLGIESEIRRVVNEYQIQQQSKLYTEVNTYGGQSSFSPDELVQGIVSIDTTAVGDVVVANVTLQTANGAVINLVRPVAA